MAAARADSNNRGWRFAEPIVVHERLRDYLVWTNAASRGGNESFVVDNQTGDVRDAAVTLR